MLRQALTSRRSIRVFFAIWPEKTVRRQLYGLSEKLETACSGRKMKASDIHLTLLFLGEIRVGQLDILRVAANTVKEQSFDFIVERISYWKFNRLVYATATEMPLELFNLVNSLKVAMSANGFLFDNRPFMPHITLIRKVNSDMLPKSLSYLDIPIIWPVNDWVLVKSEQASDRSIYIPIGRWALLAQR